MARARTTKTLAKRIQLDYFRRAHPLRTWRARASWAAMLLAAAGVAWALRPAGRIAWSGGALAPAHRMLESDCASCHGPGAPAGTAPPLPDTGTGVAPLPRIASAGSGPGAVSDAACEGCHAGPAHQARQARAPACASCHQEHRGRPLTAVEDSHCAACHAALETTAGPPEGVAAAVMGFPDDHPEFDPVTAGRDPGRLRLNHRLHLKPGLRGAAGSVTLDCASCHRAGAAGARMLPVSYERDCRACHPLLFDTEGRVPDRTEVPHGDPNAARDALIDLLASSATAEPAVTTSVDPVAAALARHRRRRAGLETPAHVPLSLPAGTDRAFVVERVGLAMAVLQRQTCALCHGRAGVDAPGDPLAASAPPPAGASLLPAAFAVPDTGVPESWMPAATFSHRAHRALACAACHAGAHDSEDTADLLLPGAQVCAACHGRSGGAPSDCVTCHRYHGAGADELAPSRYLLP